MKSKTESSLSNFVLPPNNHRVIYSLGATPLASAKDYQNAARLIQQHVKPGDLIVASASHATKKSLRAIAENSKHSLHFAEQFYFHHQALIVNCTKLAEHKKLLTELEKDHQWLTQLVNLDLLKIVNHDVLALGDLWSAKILCHLLEAEHLPASWLDARQCLKLQWHNDGYHIDESVSQNLLNQSLISRSDRITIVTGSIASDCESHSIALKKNVSNSSTVVIAKLLDAKSNTLSKDIRRRISLTSNNALRVFQDVDNLAAKSKN